MLESHVEPEEHAVRFGPFVLDIPARTLVHGADAVPLTPKELDALVVLVSLRGQVVSKDRLISQAWDGEPISDAAVFQAVYRLRRTLLQYDPYGEYIATVPGRGYQFVAPANANEPRSGTLDVASELFSCYSRALFQFEHRTQRALAAAITLFRRTLRLDPRFAPGYVGLAHAHLCAGVALFADRVYSYHRALRACRAALALDPHYGDAHAILSEIHAFFEDDVAKAQRAARTALSLAPESARVRTAAFWAHLTANDIGSAFEHVRAALTANPSSNHFTTLLGVALYYAGRYQQAHVHLTDAHVFDPGDSMALFYDACALALVGGFEAAEEQLDAMEPADRATRALALRIWMAHRRGDSARALALTESLHAAPRADDIALALALAAAGDFAAASEHAARAKRSKQTSCYLILLDPLFKPLRDYLRC